MIDTSPRRSSLLLHLALGLVFAIEGALTLIHALSEHHDLHLFAMSTTQILAALLFMWPRTMRIGGYVLVAMFTIAASVRLMRGDFPAGQLVYIIALLFVIMHGSGHSSGRPQQMTA